MGLTILNVAYPLARVGPDAVGGAEQVLTLLDDALVTEGHRSLVIATAGSVVRGELIETPPLRDKFDPAAVAEAQRLHKRAIEETLRTRHVDLVHLHGIDFDKYLPDTAIPTLATLHLPPGWYAPEVFRPRPGLHLQCVSASQRAACPGNVSLLEIANGVPVDKFQRVARKASFALALGRVCPEKGFHLAIEAAKRAGVPLVVAGEVFPYEAHERYFVDVLAPLLDRDRLFVGPIGFERKKRLLASARCLVVASQAPETSSLVAMEALASGTPVVAWRIGALPEIVEHGKTGFLVESVEELAEALSRVEEIDPATCRKEALERFDARVMTEKYLATYRRLARPMKRPGAISVDVATATDHIERLVPEWRELAGRVPELTTFSRPEWLVPWMRAHRPPQPRVIQIRRGNRLVAIVPMLRWAESDGLALGLMGGGPSDVQDAIVDPAHRDAALSAFFGYLEETSSEWAKLELDQLRSNSNLLSFGLESPWHSELEDLEPSPILSLPAGVESLPAIGRARLWENVAYYRRRLAREHQVRYERADRDTAEAVLSKLFQLHRARREMKGESDGVLSPAVEQMHRDVVRALAADGTLRLHALVLDGRTVAATYGFRYGGSICLHLCAFDPAFDKMSVGTVLVAHAVEEAVREGASRFDFLRGREPYKYAFGASDEPHRRRRLRLGG